MKQRLLSNARALAFLRISVGTLFLIFAQYKVLRPYERITSPHQLQLAVSGMRLLQGSNEMNNCVEVNFLAPRAASPSICGRQAATYACSFISPSRSLGDSFPTAFGE